MISGLLRIPLVKLLRFICIVPAGLSVMVSGGVSLGHQFGPSMAGEETETGGTPLWCKILADYGGHR